MLCLEEYLQDCCDKLFEQYLAYTENSRKKASVWSFQMMLLILCPKILEEINNADGGTPCSPQHLKKKNFIDEIKKTIANHHGCRKQLAEGAAVTVSHCVNRPPISVFMIEITLTIMMCSKCLDSHSPRIYHYVLVNALHRIITQALLCLYQPSNIEVWNPESPVNTFWDVNLPVLFSISRKLIQHQIINYTEIFKRLQDILVCRNSFLQKHSSNANVGSNIPGCKQAHIKLEIVFLMYLWSIDIDAVLTTMSCFHLLCEKAEIRCGADEMAVTQLLPNYNVYSELAAASTVLTTGRVALQKRIMALLRKIDNSSPGTSQQHQSDRFRHQEDQSDPELCHHRHGALRLVKPFPKQQILVSSKLKEFADDDF